VVAGAGYRRSPAPNTPDFTLTSESLQFGKVTLQLWPVAEILETGVIAGEVHRVVRRLSDEGGVGGGGFEVVFGINAHNLLLIRYGMG